MPVYFLILKKTLFFIISRIMITLDKTRMIFLTCFSVIIISTVLYLDSSIDRSGLPDISPKLISEISFSKTVDVDKQKIFNIMADVENYSRILPRNIVSVNILEQTQNELLVEETIVEIGITSKLLVKHTLLPYEQHIIEIMDGDAKGTKIIQKFETIGNKTKLSTNAKFTFNGVLIPFRFLPETQLIHSMDSIISNFVIYSNDFNTNSETIVDDLYREILLRPSDPIGLQHYASLLENKEITIDQLRQELLDSEEYLGFFRHDEIKTLDELDPNIKKIVDDLYREILLRPADPIGLQHYSSLLENNDITIDQLRQELLDSEEYTLNN